MDCLNRNYSNDNSAKVKNQNSYSLNTQKTYANASTCNIFTGAMSSIPDSTTSIFQKATGSENMLELVNKEPECTDGQDDGKLGFIDTMVSVRKGTSKTILNALHDKVSSPKEFAKTALVTAGTVALALNPATAPIAAVIGIVEGAKLIGAGIKGTFEANEALKNAKTDAEAKAAWENAGKAETQLTAGGFAIYSSSQGINDINTNTTELNVTYNDAIKEFENSAMDPSTYIEVDD